MISQRTGIILLGLIVILFIISAKTGLSIPDHIAKIVTNTSPVVDTTIIRHLSLINRAVTEQPDTTVFEYTGGFENPFRKWKQHRKASRSTKKTKKAPPRVQLSLKGILIKDQALAILDNGSGETQIRAAGQQAFDQYIVSISNNRVVLRDHLGTYEIFVEEE